ncbi:unnamed protein product, partial [marine sediment metagenome]
MQSTHARLRSAELAKLERKRLSFMVITRPYNVITYINIFPHDASKSSRLINDN